MPAYDLPGTEVGPRRARGLGACALVLTALLTLAWRMSPDTEPPGEIRLALLVGQVGAGVEAGTDVRLDGVRIGEVRAIRAAAPGRQRLELTLNRSQLYGLTDALSLDYAPGNLFGISTLELRSGRGGAELTEGSTVDLTEGGDRVRDATLAALLKSTGALTGDVLTPDLVALLNKSARYLDGFTPLLQALGATLRAFAETQQLPPSVLLHRFGSALAGLPPMLTGGLAVLEATYTNSYLASPERLARFSEMFTRVRTELLPVVTTLLGTSQQHFAGLLPLATLILDQVSGSISAPERSAAELSELLRRIGAAFHDSPDGPVLDVAIDLDVVPGLAVPLTTLLATEGR
ncbi:MlaD family protein [Nocardia sp. NPDC048505]|uniref:MlaD family protein n=1 Tax=Nocardia sp. NPDC048505 TaxID=3155756 RepID=UPI00340BE7CB